MNLRGAYLIHSIIFFLLFFFAWNGSLYADTRVVSNIKAWPETFLKSVNAQASTGVQFAFTNAIFDAGSDAEVFNNDFDPTNTFPLQINRDIYTNFDLLNTKTVVDRVKFYVGSPIVGVATAIPQALRLIPFPFANVSLGARGSVEFKDIRQMGADEARALPYTEPVLPKDDITEVNPYLKSSRLSFLDQAKVPFRIPLSRGHLRKMRVGEMVSYVVSGQIGVGVDFGLKILPIDIMSVGASLMLDTFLVGAFEISILKESERFARVRVSKLHGRERDIQLNAGINFTEFLIGFFIFKNSTISNLTSQVSEGVLPFQLRLASEKNHELSWGYRYDLDSDEGKDSFHRAVLGSFTESETALKNEEKSQNPSVSKLFSRSSLIQSTEHSATVDLSFLFNLRKARTNQASHSEVESGDGTDSILEDTRENQKTSRFLNGHSKNNIRKFTVLLDRDGFLSHKEGSVILSSENEIEDSRTDGKRLNEYVSSVQTLLHEDHMFPVFPESIPDPKKPNRQEKSEYGRSEFYFGYSTGELGLHDFLSRDPQLLLGQATRLGVKFNLEAFSRAKGALESRNPDELYAALNDLFEDQKHAAALSELFFSNLDESSYEKNLVAQSPAFGDFERRGHHLLPMEMEVAAVTSMSTMLPDPSATVSSLTNEVNSSHETVLRFNLSDVPQFLYFRMGVFSYQKKHPKEYDFVVFNRDGRFKRGQNELVLDSSSSDSLIHRLCGALPAQGQVIFTLGFKHAGLNWGDGASTQFRVSTP